MNLLSLSQNILHALKFVYRHGANGLGVYTHLTRQERILLYRLAGAIKEPACLVEIGSYLGASAYFLAAGASEAGSDITLYCVDTWQNDAMAEGKRDTWQEFLTNTRRFSDRIVPLRGLSADVGKSFSHEIDLLFIDGDHSLEGCKQDVEAWLPKVKKGGIILFHDYGWAVGVQTVVNDLIAKSILVKEHAYLNIFLGTKGR